MTMSAKSEHLSMIQNVIARMANNSLQIKCWTIAVIGVMVSFESTRLVIIGLIPVVLFCLMDAEYLSLEKAYRDLYESVRIKTDTEIDYSMIFEKVSIKYGLKSWSVWAFYLAICAMVVIVAVCRGLV